MELDEQPLEMIRSDTGRYAFAPGVSPVEYLRVTLPRNAFPLPFFLSGNAPRSPSMTTRKDERMTKAKLGCILLWETTRMTRFPNV